MYAQLLTAIFSIYFATIGIILSAGYTKLRRDIIHMLTNEQVGSVYSRVIVQSAMFCLAATALPFSGYEPGMFVYSVGTTLTLVSALALFPLGQRLFNFFDLNHLVRSELIPKIARHIGGAIDQKRSASISYHHSQGARQALEQLTYIDKRVRENREGLEHNLTALTNDYTGLLVHYLQRKNNISQDSYWFPKRHSYKEWLFSDDTLTTIALESSSQQILRSEKPDHQWFESHMTDQLMGHIELAFEIGNFELANKLLGRFSNRIPTYAECFQFSVGIDELNKQKEIIDKSFLSKIAADETTSNSVLYVSDTWTAQGSYLCLETLKQMLTFEKQLALFFTTDDWSEKSLQQLPPFIQMEFAFIAKQIRFEEEIEGRRLSKPKYVQQLAVRKLLLHYDQVLPQIVNFCADDVPEFASKLTKMRLPLAATQVILANLHSLWKLQRWFEDISDLLNRYNDYQSYPEPPYQLPKINIEVMLEQLALAREEAISMLGSQSVVEHVFKSKHDDQIPDHFGQIYFELSDACIKALEQNKQSKLDNVLPMFIKLASLATATKFSDPSLNVNDEYRLQLISGVINDLASVLGFAILYGAYHKNENLTESALSQFESHLQLSSEKEKYLIGLLHLSNPFSFRAGAAPRALIRTSWRISFEQRARQDGYGDRLSMGTGIPHPDKIVREFLKSSCDASHLFFAKWVVPQIGPIDFEIDFQITDLVRRLSEGETST